MKQTQSQRVQEKTIDSSLNKAKPTQNEDVVSNRNLLNNLKNSIEKEKYREEKTELVSKPEKPKTNQVAGSSEKEKTTADLILRTNDTKYEDNKTEIVQLKKNKNGLYSYKVKKQKGVFSKKKLKVSYSLTALAQREEENRRNPAKINRILPYIKPLDRSEEFETEKFLKIEINLTNERMLDDKNNEVLSQKKTGLEHIRDMNKRNLSKKQQFILESVKMVQKQETKEAEQKEENASDYFEVFGLRRKTDEDEDTENGGENQNS